MSVDPSTKVSPNETFFRHFTQRVNEISAKIDLVGSPDISKPQRSEKVNECLVNIAGLQDEVKDASTYIPPYDQRSCANSIKELSTKLERTKAIYAPKSRFAFKAGSGSLLARKKVTLGSSEDAIASTHPNPSSQEIISQPRQKTVIEPSREVVVTSDKSALVKLPETLSHPFPNIHLEKIDLCVINFDELAPNNKQIVLPSVTLNTLSNSVILLPEITGAIHLTRLRHCLVGVRSCAQFRMHECHQVQVFMYCTSNPIVEDVSEVGFAPFPTVLTNLSGSNTHISKQQPNRYDQVQDFRWLKPTQSPNWYLIPIEEQVIAAERCWSTVPTTRETSSLVSPNISVEGKIVEFLMLSGTTAIRRVK